MRSTLVLTSAVLLFLVFSIPVNALECPPFPEQTEKDLEFKVNTEVGKIGPVKGGELETQVKTATKELMSSLPSADRVYLEHMMFSSYCSSLKDNKQLSDRERTQQLREYNHELRQAIYGKSVSAAPPPSSPNSTEPRETWSKLRPDGVKGSVWWTGREPEKAFDGNLRSLWGMQWDKARGASLEILFRVPRTLYALRLYTPPNKSAYRLEKAILIGDSGSRREIVFKGFNEWEEVAFEPLEATILKLEVDEIRKGSSGFLAVNEIELMGK